MDASPVDVEFTSNDEKNDTSYPYDTTLSTT